MAHDRNFRVLPLLSAALLLALAGCSKNEPSTTTTTTTTSQPAATAAATPTAAPAAAPAASAIQSQDANQAGVVAELTECKRADGVLTVKIRFRNTTGKPVSLEVLSFAAGYEKYYVTAGSKKYFILKDSEGAYLTTQANSFGNLNVNVEPGQSWQWWAKFPAPPADTTKVSVFTPITPPFDDVPISDK